LTSREFFSLPFKPATEKVGEIYRLIRYVEEKEKCRDVAAMGNSGIPHNCPNDASVGSPYCIIHSRKDKE